MPIPVALMAGAYIGVPIVWPLVSLGVTAGLFTYPSISSLEWSELFYRADTTILRKLVSVQAGSLWERAAKQLRSEMVGFLKTDKTFYRVCENMERLYDQAQIIKRALPNQQRFFVGELSETSTFAESIQLLRNQLLAVTYDPEWAESFKMENIDLTAGVVTALQTAEYIDLALAWNNRAVFSPVGRAQVRIDLDRQHILHRASFGLMSIQKHLYDKATPSTAFALVSLDQLKVLNQAPPRVLSFESVLESLDRMKTTHDAASNSSFLDAIGPELREDLFATINAMSYHEMVRQVMEANHGELPPSIPLSLAHAEIPQEMFNRAYSLSAEWKTVDDVILQCEMCMNLLRGRENSEFELFKTTGEMLWKLLEIDVNQLDKNNTEDVLLQKSDVVTAEEWKQLQEANPTEVKIDIKDHTEAPNRTPPGYYMYKVKTFYKHGTSDATEQMGERIREVRFELTELLWSYATTALLTTLSVGTAMYVNPVASMAALVVLYKALVGVFAMVKFGSRVVHTVGYRSIEIIGSRVVRQLKNSTQQRLIEHAAPMEAAVNAFLEGGGSNPQLLLDAVQPLANMVVSDVQLHVASVPIPDAAKSRCLVVLDNVALYWRTWNARHMEEDVPGSIKQSRYRKRLASTISFLSFGYLYPSPPPTTDSSILLLLLTAAAAAS